MNNVKIISAKQKGNLVELTLGEVTLDGHSERDQIEIAFPMCYEVRTCATYTWEEVCDGVNPLLVAVIPPISIPCPAEDLTFDDIAVMRDALRVYYGDDVAKIDKFKR